MITAEAKNISKSYGKVKAVKNISFSAEKGELFGFIGPDGAGKTTLFRILTTLLIADSGSATIEGRDTVKNYKWIRKNIGYMPGRFSLYQDLTVEENITFFATIFGTTLQENYELVKPIYSQIELFKKRRAGALSGGMKQKLALSCALIHKPKVLILDEPTTGVDAVSRKEFWDMLKNLKEMGITILVSTPYMDEASLCDRVALVQNGEVLSIDTPQNITKNFDKVIYAVKSQNMYRLILDLSEYQYTESVFPFGQDAHYIDKRGAIDENEIVELLSNKGHEGIEILKINAGIEDCFMNLMSKK